jgi:hypothetical protein
MNIPTYECDKVNNKLTFHCPLCMKVHTHGPEEGHRISHCNNSDHHPNGYFLKNKGENNEREFFEISLDS